MKEGGLLQKEAFEKTALFSVIRDAVMTNFPAATEFTITQTRVPAECDKGGRELFRFISLCTPKASPDPQVTRKAPKSPQLFPHPP
ncbi:hypothetical protein QQF64_006186 [Cirrhinus molitorella]|uniref:Uncharacterized protein n=1 Tax=Cirrhinus molitorella TaxID=172907 RepID=A0ABR3MEB1_9TELE